MLLLTTPDYLPRIGGLTSHTLNVEKVLRELSIEYELFHWKDYRDIMQFPKEKLDKYHSVLNIHSGFHMFMPKSHPRVVNFVNGAEILFYSPNLLKHVYKQLTRRRAISRVEEAYYNIFISEFTFNALIKKGLRPNYARDVIHHMAVDVKEHQFQVKSWNENSLRFICVARDVPHKNFAGAIRFCEKVQEFTGKKVELITVTNKEFKSEKIQIKSFINPDNKKRDELLALAHLNILFSLDHSGKGFFEGFGQIVQEAGCFGTPSIVLKTGGLPESVHHGQTGWVLNDLNDHEIKNWLGGMNNGQYEHVAQECYQHTIASHGLHTWSKLFGTILKITEKNE